MANNFSIVIPTRNAGDRWIKLIKSIFSQSIKARHLLVIDSNSSDSTPLIAAEWGCDLMSTDPSNFNHGRVRNDALSLTGDSDFIVYLTQDAILESNSALESLLDSFKDESVGMAYGRQLPHLHSGPIGAHARIFNYPDQSLIKKISDSKKLGIKTAFVSNSFAAYRRTALEAAGGFPTHTILSEDTYVAAQMLLLGWKVAYKADARVFHSHDYSYAEEFRRYFDTGVFHCRESWIIDQFGKSEAEGMRFIRSELNYLFENAPFLIPSAIARTFLKYSAFKLGQHEKILPNNLKRMLSMHKNYWANSL